MPNWCYNRVTAYADDVHNAKLEEVKKIFESKTPFNDIFPMPDWKNTPNENGELPKLEQMKNPDGSILWETYNWPDGTNDDRWYSWCVHNWDTKWEPDMHDIDYEDSEILAITFNTAWSPPEEIHSAISEQFDDLSMSWFYDEPGCEVAGYL